MLFRSTVPVATEPEPIFDEFSLSSILQTNVAQAGYYTNSYASSDFLSAGFRASSIEIFGGTGISAFLDIDFENSITIVEWGKGYTDGITDRWLEIEIERDHTGASEVREVIISEHNSGTESGSAANA